MSNEEIGKRLRTIRGNHTQAAFAASLDIHPNTLRAYEAGRMQLGAAVMIALAKRYNVDLNWLLTGAAYVIASVKVEVTGPVDLQLVHASKHVNYPQR